MPFQPFAAQIERLLLSMESLGAPLHATERDRIRESLRARSAEAEREGFRAITEALAPQVLLDVEINPEMRLSVRRGAAPAELLQHGWRTFLVRVLNHAGTTPKLTLRSPQGGPVGRRSSLAITGVHDFTNGAVDEVEARNRWLEISTFDAPPMTPTLSGLEVEYRIVQIYSRDAGPREATLRADAGYGDQDLGFRSSLPILFHSAPAHAVRFDIFGETGTPCAAAILLTDAHGHVYPAQTKRELPDLNFQPHVYRYNGEHLFLPAGEYAVAYGRGPEYLKRSQTLRVSEGGPNAVSLHLERWITPAQHGYYSGDTHIHAAGCSHYESPTEGVTPLVMQRQVDGEALDLGSVLNWGPGFNYQKQFFTGHVLHAAGMRGMTPDNGRTLQHASSQGASGVPPAPIGMEHDAEKIAARQDAEILHSLQQRANGHAEHSLLRYDIEASGFPSSHCGHLVLLQLHDQGYPGTKTVDDWPSWNMPILRWAKAQGGVVGYAHSAHGLVVDSTELPNLVMPPFNSMGANEFIADVTHEGVVDFISGCDLWPFAELNIWYHTMNCGYQTAFAGETDFPCLTDACVGGGRSYAALPSAAADDAGYAHWLQNLLHGSSYFGDGRCHLFRFQVNGHLRGRQPLRLSEAGSVEITAEVCAFLETEPDAATRAIQHASAYERPYWHVERARKGSTRQVDVEIVVNGIAVDRKPLEADGQVRPVRFDVSLQKSSWIALRIYPSVHTNPIVVEVGGKPVRASLESATWCRKAVDVCWEQKRQRIRPSEMEAAATAFQHAREAYDRILQEMPSA